MILGQVFQRIDGESLPCPPDLHVQRPKASAAFQGQFHHLESILRRRKFRFVGRVAVGYEKHFIQRELVHCGFGHQKVAVVDGVERSAHDAVGLQKHLSFLIDYYKPFFGFGKAKSA